MAGNDIFSLLFGAAKVIAKTKIKQETGIDLDSISSSKPTTEKVDGRGRYENVGGGKTLGELTKEDRAKYNNECGVYRMMDKTTGETVYVGRAVEHNNGGFRKRVADYTRESDTGRKHKSGQYIYEHKDNLMVQFKSTGTGKEGADKAKQLEKQTIENELKKGAKLINVQHNREK